MTVHCPVSTPHPTAETAGTDPLPGGKGRGRGIEWQHYPTLKQPCPAVEPLHLHTNGGGEIVTHKSADTSCF
jgi:hypothetical protein